MMELPVSFECRLGEEDFYRYHGIREGARARPLFAGMTGWMILTGFIGLGQGPVQAFGMWSLSLLFLIPAAMGRFPTVRAGRAAQVRSYLLTHGARPGEATCRQVVEIGPQGVTVRCGADGAPDDRLATIPGPWRRWRRAVASRGSVTVLSAAGQAGALRDLAGVGYLLRGAGPDSYEDVYIPARALGGASARRLARELNRMIERGRRGEI
ncbi:hypothetical protein Corgl_0022 [Coriobacterium glomerans PW2]|uniref:YcxB-like protein domain-containing protein n=1 Tax=Coriobacterium glomerans (strain ATCC 49209 / DSM 20642 / JCM 10262 / PW2) TaxID=700015 RepID=F2N6V3_CORGP|nr:hypothetical protein [Coriobacterium glomerans]AEB06152.1 hypothetical protein Corgl_0022 [Coriobacterium glomerans PW2]